MLDMGRDDSLHPTDGAQPGRQEVYTFRTTDSKDYFVVAVRNTNNTFRALMVMELRGEEIVASGIWVGTDKWDKISTPYKKGDDPLLLLQKAGVYEGEEDIPDESVIKRLHDLNLIQRSMGREAELPNCILSQVPESRPNWNRSGPRR